MPISSCGRFVFFILFALCAVNAALAKSAPEWVAEVVDYEEMAGFLKDLKEYHCFLEDEGAGIRRVSVAKKSKKDREVFAFRMVAEPNAFGTWKIFSIEREGKE